MATRSKSKSILAPGSRGESYVSTIGLANLKEASKEGIRSKSKVSIKKSIKDFTADIDDYSQNCDCGPDFYTKVLGPTVDEAFLETIATFSALCGKVAMPCDPIKPIREATRKSISIAEPETEAETEPDAPPLVTPKMVSEILQTVGLSPEMASAIIQTSIASINEKRPSLRSNFMQTSTPELVSQILQTIGLEPEMTEAIVQTSFPMLQGSLSKQPSSTPSQGEPKKKCKPKESGQSILKPEVAAAKSPSVLSTRVIVEEEPKKSRISVDEPEPKKSVTVPKIPSKVPTIKEEEEEECEDEEEDKKSLIPQKSQSQHSTKSKKSMQDVAETPKKRCCCCKCRPPAVKNYEPELKKNKCCCNEKKRPICRCRSRSRSKSPPPSRMQLSAPFGDSCISFCNNIKRKINCFVKNRSDKSRSMSMHKP